MQIEGIEYRGVISKRDRKTNHRRSWKPKEEIILRKGEDGKLIGTLKNHESLRNNPKSI